MRKYALQQYESMENEIQKCRREGFAEEYEIECCYQLCSKYWQRISHLLKVHHFSTDEEEIDFFKNIKPLFTSTIEYYNLLYHAQLFSPSYDKMEREKFWSRESLRLERFSETHTDFYHYIKNGDTGRDKLYFLRRNHDSSSITAVYESELKTSAAADRLLAEYLALVKYSNHVHEQLERINETANENR